MDDLVTFINDPLDILATPPDSHQSILLLQRLFPDRVIQDDFLPHYGGFARRPQGFVGGLDERFYGLVEVEGGGRELGLGHTVVVVTVVVLRNAT